MAVDPHSHVPVYEQIVEYVYGAIATGVYRPDEPLPSIRAMALELLVNPNTVQRAYQELERQGIVYTRKGLGVFVASNGSASARSRTETSVRERFEQGVGLGRSAGLSNLDLKRLFEHSLRDATDQADQSGAKGLSDKGAST
ncbi:MAG TPA: GntR family transcriptional regulator [Phycisphaerae bacterium]|nr:GntR family transcriptional regulator [Phycisphaerae bacterium]